MSASLFERLSRRINICERDKFDQHIFQTGSVQNQNDNQCILPTSSTIPMSSSLVISIFSNSDAPANTRSISSFDNSENFSIKVPSMNPVAGDGDAVMIVESSGDFGDR